MESILQRAQLRAESDPLVAELLKHHKASEHALREECQAARDWAKAVDRRNSKDNNEVGELKK